MTTKAKQSMVFGPSGEDCDALISVWTDCVNQIDIEAAGIIKRLSYLQKQRDEFNKNIKNLEEISKKYLTKSKQ